MSRSRTILEARLHGTCVLRFETGLGETAGPEHFETTPDTWALTGAWRRSEPLDGTHIERWLRGLRPQNGARTAQEARARRQLVALHIKRAAPDQADIIWATPHIEYPGAVEFRSLFDDGEPLAWERAPTHPLQARSLAALLDQVIDEMRHGTTDPRVLDLKPTSPSGSLPKFAAHRGTEDGLWYLPDKDRLSTHIVKHEDRADVPAEAAIESICQRTLRALGVRAARTYAMMIGNRQVVVSERSDRWVDTESATVLPIHQEEWACACARDPDELTQREGTGGGWADLYKFLTERSDDRETEQQHFWRALVAITLLGHRDIHRRNIGVLYPQPDEPYRAELAPLYDVASMDGQIHKEWRSLGLAIGGEDEIDKVGEKAWVRMANECRADPAEVLSFVSDIAGRLPRVLDQAIEQARAEDEWRDREVALHRIEALRHGIGRRTKKALRPTVHAQRRPPAPEWVDAVADALEAGYNVELKANAHDRSLIIIVQDDEGTTWTAGTARTPRAFYQALLSAGVVNPAEVPELEKTLERERDRQLALARARERKGG